MGKQYNKKQKRVRRKRYVERRNARVRSGVAQA
jgi:hypothetical protein